jgi:preprotein translocase subunit YajC
MEKRMRDAARASYRQKLLDELQRQETVLDTGGQADAKA